MDKIKLTTIVLAAAITLSGCAERGYKLSVEPSIHTASAQTATDIRKHSPHTIKETFKKMEKAVKKALKPTKKKKIRSTPIEKESQNISQSQQKTQKEKLLKAAKTEKKRQVAEKKKTPLLLEKQKHQNMLTKKHEKKQTETTQKEANKLKVQEEQHLLNKESEKKAKEALLQKEKIKMIEEEKKRQREAKKAQIEKEKKLKAALMKQEEKSFKSAKPGKSYTNFSDPISFIYLNKTYHKFGTSEIHGHVVYVSPSGDEIQLNNAKVYLLPVGANLNFWYKNYYLKNKNFGFKKLKAYYLNKTELDLERNFAFYGVPAGNYYIIIEATHPTSKNKKIYIAKKIKVEKYKKVLAVFSKRL